MNAELVLQNSTGNALLVSAATREQYRAVLEEGTPENTRRAYEGDLKYFWAWGDAALGMQPAYPVPVAAVIQFILDHLPDTPAASVDQRLVDLGVKAQYGPHKLATICRRVSALSIAHTLQKVNNNPCQSPEVRVLLSKARKAAVKKGQGPQKKKAATKDILDALLTTCDSSLIGVRDRALLLFAFSSGGRRRSEVAAAQIEYLTPAGVGYVYRIPYSKTDQNGQGREVPIVGRAAEALKQWLDASQLVTGPLFRGVGKGGRILGDITDKVVVRTMKKRSALAGLDPALFGAHSLRSGFITEGGRQGVGLGDIMALSGHKTVGVAMGYYQAGAVLNNPAARLAE